MHDSTSTATDTVQIPGRTRPSTAADLDAYQQQGHHVATIADTSQWMRFPDLGHHLLNVLQQARADGLTVTDDGRIEIPLTDDEIGDRIRVAQRGWDRERDTYLAALNGVAPTTDYGWRRDQVNAWARAEGVREIDWTTFPEAKS